MSRPDDAGRSVERLAVPFSRPSPVEIHRPDDADGSVVFALHGQGMSPRSFGREALPAMPPRATVVLPQAPLPFEVRKPTDDGVRFKQGNSWYVYLGDTPDFLIEMERTEEWLATVHDSVFASHPDLDPLRTTLLGFSQGGYLAGFVALRDPIRWRRLVVCGARIKHEVLEDEARATAADQPSFRILAVHGRDDAGVRPGPSRESAEQITSWGVPVEARLFDGGHHVLRQQDCQDAVREFLAAPFESA